MQGDWCQRRSSNARPSRIVLGAGETYRGASVSEARRSQAGGAEKEMSKPLDQPAPYNGSATNPEPIEATDFWGRIVAERLFRRSMLEQPTIRSMAPQRPIHTADLNWKGK